MDRSGLQAACDEFYLLWGENGRVWHLHIHLAYIHVKKIDYQVFDVIVKRS